MLQKKQHSYIVNSNYLYSYIIIADSPYIQILKNIMLSGGLVKNVVLNLCAYVTCHKVHQENCCFENIKFSPKYVFRMLEM